MKSITCKQLPLLSIFVLLMSAFSLSANEHAYRALSFVDGVKQPAVSLNGAWQFRFKPSGKWETVQVPGGLGGAIWGYQGTHAHVVI